MKLSLTEVEHIAELAKLGLTDEEKTTFREQLSAILEYAERLKQVDSSDVPPTPAVLPLRNVMRDDAVEPSLSPEDVLGNAPQAAKQCFQVQIILDWTE